MKRHFVQTEVRLIEGTNVTAACGALVTNVAWPLFLDISAGVLDTVSLGNSLLNCQNCVRELFRAIPDGCIYLYALVPGAESKNEEAA